MGRLHDQFMQDPAPTDVITFPGDESLNLAGEICVCPDVARAFAREHGSNFARELTLYIVHGYLHLCGFDDTSTTARRKMRTAERVALTIATRASAVLRPTLR